MLLWPVGHPGELENRHPDLPPDHPHWSRGAQTPRNSHALAYVIDNLHFLWLHGR